MTAIFAKAVRSFAEVPGPTSLPLIGNSYLYSLGVFDRFAYQDTLKTLYNQYGPVVKENLWGSQVVHVFEPEDIKTVMTFHFCINLLRIRLPNSRNLIFQKGRF